MNRAVILAGGEGTRLRPYTTVLPKPLMPIGDRPVLDIVVRQLKAHGFERITIATGYLAELIEAFFRDGESYGIPIDYYREHEPLGTVGALALIDGLRRRRHPGDERGRAHRHRLRRAAGAPPRQRRRRDDRHQGAPRCRSRSACCASAMTGDPTRLTGYDEKPAIDYIASMGVYCFAPRALAHIEPGERLDFPDLILRLIAAGEIVRAWPSDDYWLDIGRHDDYEQAQEEFESVRDRLIPPDG